MKPQDEVFVPNHLGLYVPAIVHHVTDTTVTALLKNQDGEDVDWWLGPKDEVFPAS